MEPLGDWHLGHRIPLVLTFLLVCVSLLDETLDGLHGVLLHQPCEMLRIKLKFIIGVIFFYAGYFS